MALFFCAVAMRHYTYYNLSKVAQHSASVLFTTLSEVPGASLAVLVAFLLHAPECLRLGVRGVARRPPRRRGGRLRRQGPPSLEAEDTLPPLHSSSRGHAVLRLALCCSWFHCSWFHCSWFHCTRRLDSWGAVSTQHETSPPPESGVLVTQASKLTTRRPPTPTAASSRPSASGTCPCSRWACPSCCSRARSTSSPSRRSPTSAGRRISASRCGCRRARCEPPKRGVVPPPPPRARRASVSVEASPTRPPLCVRVAPGAPL